MNMLTTDSPLVSRYKFTRLTSCDSRIITPSVGSDGPGSTSPSCPGCRYLVRALRLVPRMACPHDSTTLSCRNIPQSYAASEMFDILVGEIRFCFREIRSVQKSLENNEFWAGNVPEMRWPSATRNRGKKQGFGPSKNLTNLITKMDDFYHFWKLKMIWKTVMFQSPCLPKWRHTVVDDQMWQKKCVNKFYGNAYFSWLKRTRIEPKCCKIWEKLVGSWAP